MNRTSLPLTLAASLALAAGTARAQLEAEGTYWLTTPEGTGSVGIDGVAGTTFDLEDDLGYDDAEGTPGAAVHLGTAHQLGVCYLQLDISAENEIDRNIRYEDLLFRVNTRVASSLEATLVRGYYRMNLGNDTFRGGILLGGQYLDFTGELASPDVGNASAQVRVGMPIVGGHLRLQPVPFLALRAAVNGLSWSFDDVDATYWEADGSAILTMDRGLFAGIGYRHLVIDVTDDGDLIDVDLAFTGPYAAAGLTW